LRKFRFFEDQIQSILDRKKLLKLDFLQKKLDDRNVKIVTIYDRDYPELLKEIQNPPYFFYLR
jgi:predicted Rossmann fold nucleotide-binding protein DprA/Smf involved in DNA uptake